LLGFGQYRFGRALIHEIYQSQSCDNRNSGVAKYGLKPLSTNPVLTHLLKTTQVKLRGFRVDLVEIGDRATLNDDCVLQTHLFEDGVLKASWLRVGADCSVGALSVVPYDSVMENGSRLDALSLVMKGETLPARTPWAGVPASWRARGCAAATRKAAGHQS